MINPSSAIANPFQSPQTDPGNSRAIIRLAENLKKLKATDGAFFTLLRINSRKLLIFYAIQLLLGFVVWKSEFRLLEMLFSGWFTGSLIKDLEFLKSEFRNWSTTKELVDWNKVESLAGEPIDIHDKHSSNS